jgi:hypothetical protein
MDYTFDLVVLKISHVATPMSLGRQTVAGALPAVRIY